MNILNLRIMGAYFGYPQCCIDQFCEDFCHVTKQVYPHLLGTGYVPCVACARRIEATSLESFTAQYIVPNRRHLAPFPDYDDGYTALARAYLFHFAGKLPAKMPIEIQQAANQAIANEGIETFLAHA